MIFRNRCFYCFLLSPFLISTYLHAQDLTLATGINSDPPFVYGDLDLDTDYPGITIEILNLVEQKTGIKLNIVKRPWARVVADVKSNILDGGFHFSYKEDRKKFVSYPIREGEVLPDKAYSISNRSYALYRLKGEKIYWNGESIVHQSNDPAIVAAIRGGSITEKLMTLEVNLEQVNTDEQLLKLLLLERVDCVVGLENMIDAKIETLLPEQRKLIEKTYPVVVNKPYYVAFSKNFYRDHPLVAWKIWEEIEIIKSSGELTQILNRYSDRSPHSINM